MLDLLLPPFATAMIILLTHAYLGLHVIQREVIFVDLALAQIAAFGGTMALLAGFEHGTNAAFAFALAFTLIGALIFSFTRSEDSPVPQEALIGTTFVVASAAVLLVSSFSAEGTEHLQETLSGALIWVTWPTFFKMAATYAAVLAFHFFARQKLLATSFAPERIDNLRLWDFIFYATFGVVITASVQVAGVLMVFSSLVIPAIIAFLYTRSFRNALLIAWASGTVAIVAGLGLSFALDVTTGPVLVVTFGAVLLVALMFRRRFGVRVTDRSERGLIVEMFQERG